MSTFQDKSAFQINPLQYRLLRMSVVVVFIFLLTAIAKRLLAMARSSSQHPQDTNGVLAVITNSGSTNAPGSTITINKDGSGTLAFQKRGESRRFTQYVNKTLPPNTLESSQLEKILTQIKDVETIPKRECIKSISFGSTTTITYQGKTSSDISCLTDEDAKIFQDLKSLVQSIRSQV
jgi:hypothetical protein